MIQSLASPPPGSSERRSYVSGLRGRMGWRTSRLSCGGEGGGPHPVGEKKRVVIPRRHKEGEKGGFNLDRKAKKDLTSTEEKKVRVFCVGGIKIPSSCCQTKEGDLSQI